LVFLLVLMSMVPIQLPFLTILFVSILNICAAHRNLCNFINLTIFLLIIRISNSSFIFILHVLSLSNVGPYIFLSTLLSKTSRRFCSVTVIAQRPHMSSKKRRRRSWIESCLNDTSAEEVVRFLETAISISDTPSNFFGEGGMGRVKDKTYFPPMYYIFDKIESLIMQNDCKYQKAFMYGTRSRIVFLCVWLQIEHILNLHRVKKHYDLLFTAM
jgi:hypothetical protein